MNKISETQLAFLRGVNVGQAKRIAMEDLRSLMESLGYKDVRTVLNSGNVIFSTEESSRLHTEDKIEQAIFSRFGFSVNVTVLTSSELDQIICENPLGNIVTDFSRYIIYLLKNRDDLAGLKSLNEQNWGSEILAIGTLAAYIWCAEGVVASKLVKACERLLGQNVTGRNWATILKLQATIKERQN